MPRANLIAAADCQKRKDFDLSSFLSFSTEILGENREWAIYPPSNPPIIKKNAKAIKILWIRELFRDFFEFLSFTLLFFAIRINFFVFQGKFNEIFVLSNEKGFIYLQSQNRKGFGEMGEWLKPTVC